MEKIPKKWRELPIKEKLSIPEEYFKIDRKEIEKIRKIDDPKKRLIEAARIQYELFKDIHTFLTVWIAGYASDGAIRQYFGSTSNLRNILIKPLKQIKGIDYSWSDVKRNIKIPDEMTEELAEETGIHIGDGNLYKGKDKHECTVYQYGITGNLIDEYIYHTVHIKNLFKSLFNIEPFLSQRKNKNSIDSRIRSKAIISFKNKILGLCFGSKKDIKIPSEILKNNEFMKKCIVGILDTDFNITKYLAISGKIYSMHVAKAMHFSFKKNNIDHVYKDYGNYARFYIQKNAAYKIINEWQMHNPKHLSKIKVFGKFGKFIPFTTTPERLALLDGKIDINELEEISKKRADGKKKASLFSYK